MHDSFHDALDEAIEAMRHEGCSDEQIRRAVRKGVAVAARDANGNPDLVDILSRWGGEPDFGDAETALMLKDYNEWETPNVRKKAARGRKKGTN